MAMAAIDTADLIKAIQALPKPQKTKVLSQDTLSQDTLSPDDEKLVVGVRLYDLKRTPGTKLRWTQHDEQRKVLYKVASQHYIRNATDLTPELVNEIMRELDLDHLDHALDTRGQSIFDNVVTKIMNFYDYNMPKYMPLQNWTIDWSKSCWDGDTSAPLDADKGYRPVPARDSVDNVSGHKRNIIQTARRLRKEDGTSGISITTEIPPAPVAEAETAMEVEDNTLVRHDSAQPGPEAPKPNKATRAPKPGRPAHRVLSAQPVPEQKRVSKETAGSDRRQADVPLVGDDRKQVSSTPISDDVNNAKTTTVNSRRKQDKPTAAAVVSKPTAAGTVKFTEAPIQLRRSTRISARKVGKDDDALTAPKTKTGRAQSVHVQTRSRRGTSPAEDAQKRLNESDAVVTNAREVVAAYGAARGERLLRGYDEAAVAWNVGACEKMAVEIADMAVDLEERLAKEQFEEGEVEGEGDDEEGEDGDGLGEGEEEAETDDAAEYDSAEDGGMGSGDEVE